MRLKNVFVVGMDEFNQEKLNALPMAETHRFHPLLSLEDTKQGGTYPLPECMQKAEAILDKFDQPIDAIVGFWDFPVSSMVPLLCRKYGLRSASVESVLKCEHKYWSRHLQSQVIDDIPRFVAVNPWDDEAFDKIDLELPFWLKPVKSFSSHLAFEIDSREEFQRALGEVREKIGHIAKPFNWFMQQANEAPELQQIDGWYCIAEEPIRGAQCTLEGYVLDGKVHTHGLIDSMSYPDSSAFHRYQYPSKLPETVKQRMIKDARKVLQHIGYDNQTYNIEFFYDAEEDRLRLLEINQRISQSHAELFERVDGVSNHQVMLDVALGNRSELPKGQGPYPMAAKCFLRRFDSGRVSRAPRPEEIAQLQKVAPGVVVNLAATEGMQLSTLIDQDAYSYVLAEIYLGGSSEDEILRSYARVVDALKFEFDATDPPLSVTPVGANPQNEPAGLPNVPPASH